MVLSLKPRRPNPAQAARLAAEAEAARLAAAAEAAAAAAKRAAWLKRKAERANEPIRARYLDAPGSGLPVNPRGAYPVASVEGWHRKGARCGPAPPAPRADPASRVWPGPLFLGARRKSSPTFLLAGLGGGAVEGWVASGADRTGYRRPPRSPMLDWPFDWPHHMAHRGPSARRNSDW